MKAKLYQVSLIALSLFSVGQTAPPSESKPGPDQFSINETYNGEPHTFEVNPKYQYAEAYAGNNKLDLKITITKALGEVKDPNRNKNLEITDCTPEEKSSGIEIKKGRSESQERNGLQFVTDTDFSVRIDAGTEPRRHRIKLSLFYPDQKIFDVFFVIRVYEKSDVKQSIVKKVDEAGIPKFYTGDFVTYPITLRNSFSDYNLKVTKISVESDPEELIDFTENGLVNGPVTVGPKEEKRVELKFKVRNLSFTNLISGFGENPKLKLIVTYSDEYERVTTDSSRPLIVKIRPSDTILVIAMVLGVVVGVVLRIFLLKPSKKGPSTQLWKLVFYTVLFGLVITAVALLGEVQIIAFKLSGSYDRPIVIFLIALIGTVGGVQLFLGWLKFNPKAGTDGLEEGEVEEKPAKRRQRRERSNNEKRSGAESNDE